MGSYSAASVQAEEQKSKISNALAPAWLPSVENDKAHAKGVAMTKVCISFAGASGLSGFPEFPLAAAQQLQAEFPETKVACVQDPDPRRRWAELVDTDILFAVRFSPEDLHVAKQLKWLHLSSAGATHVLFPELIESDIIVTKGPRLVTKCYHVSWSVISQLFWREHRTPLTRGDTR